jgi:hypothetical protein
MEPEGSFPCSQEPKPVLVLSQMHPVHTFPPCFRKIHYGLIITYEDNKKEKENEVYKKPTYYLL